MLSGGPLYGISVVAELEYGRDDFFVRRVQIDSPRNLTPETTNTSTWVVASLGRTTKVEMGEWLNCTLWIDAVAAAGPHSRLRLSLRGFGYSSSSFDDRFFSPVNSSTLTSSPTYPNPAITVEGVSEGTLKKDGWATAYGKPVSVENRRSQMLSNHGIVAGKSVSQC